MHAPTETRPLCESKTEKYTSGEFVYADNTTGLHIQYNEFIEHFSLPHLAADDLVAELLGNLDTDKRLIKWLDGFIAACEAKQGS